MSGYLVGLHDGGYHLLPVQGRQRAVPCWLGTTRYLVVHTMHLLLHRLDVLDVDVTPVGRPLRCFEEVHGTTVECVVPLLCFLEASVKGREVRVAFEARIMQYDQGTHAVRPARVLFSGSVRGHCAKRHRASQSIEDFLQHQLAPLLWQN